MYTVMDRGDTNGDGCLDRSELLTLAKARPAQTAVRGFGHGSYQIGPDTEVSSRRHLEGAIDDLGLETPRKEPALAIVTTFSCGETDGGAARGVRRALCQRRGGSRP